MSWPPVPFIASFMFAILTAPLASGADQSWTPEAMMALKQVGAVQVAPDGKQVAYVVRQAVISGEKSEFVFQIVIASTDGTGEFPLTRGESSSEAPQWSPDGEQVAFPETS
jgi:dipeptidyl aminopeptidase/acylaminoacyl peptidase